MQSPTLQRAMVYRLVALGFLVMFLSTSIKSVYQVYFSQLAVHFGTGRADLAWSGSLFMLVTGLMSPLCGALCERAGPLRTLLAGALAGGAALIGMALVPQSLTAFVLIYGIGAAFALAAMTYVPMGMLVDRLFEQRKKGLAYAIVTNGTAVGFIVLSPFWIWLQPKVDWTTAFLVTGLVLAGPVAALVAWASKAAAASGLAQPERRSTSESGAWRQVCSDPGFYALALGFLGCGATMAFIDVHLVPYWQDAGTPRAQMGLSMSLLGVLELASGLATGWLAMCCSKRVLLGAFYALRSLAMLMLLSGVPVVHTMGFAAVFGASYLGTVVLTSMYCFERYGPQVKGRVFGVLFLVHQLGAFASVQFGAWCYDLTGSYRLSILLLASLTVLAAIASWIGLRHPSRDLGRDTALVASA
ncbi:MFS transporter [Variovorax sp. PBL-E5]|uniref:MFS transporter n=1 Tax=Variovorax sp. PBL-E5 TaxID=434014 RepID=UPI001316699E|nr:MFS transporter [Variovorax sp. PBL-E5]VTU28880.1 D-galactonate transporter [Variovorax sp. PBL-E5]